MLNIHWMVVMDNLGVAIDTIPGDMIKIELLEVSTDRNQMKVVSKMELPETAILSMGIPINQAAEALNGLAIGITEIMKAHLEGDKTPWPKDEPSTMMH